MDGARCECIYLIIPLLSSSNVYILLLIAFFIIALIGSSTRQQAARYRLPLAAFCTALPRVVLNAIVAGGKGQKVVAAIIIAIATNILR